MIWEVEQIRGGRWHRPGHHDETVILWSKSSIPAVRSSISSLKQTILKLYYTGCRTSKMALEMGTFTFINAVKCLRKSDFILIKVHSWRFTHFLFFFFFKVTIQTIKNYFFWYNSIYTLEMFMKQLLWSVSAHDAMPVKIIIRRCFIALQCVFDCLHKLLCYQLLEVTDMISSKLLNMQSVWDSAF